MKKYKLIISYDGTDYVGWQSQSNGRGIQNILSAKLSELTQEKISAVGASRTDAGVHALGQVASFETKSQLRQRNFLEGLNSLLPKDIRVNLVEEVSLDFQPTWHAIKKKYRYLILMDPIYNPFLVDRVWHFPDPLNVDKMKEAANFLVGKQNFASFMATGSSAKTTLREIYNVLLTMHQGDDIFHYSHQKENGNLLKIEIEGNGFLRHMIRIIVGTLVEIGLEKRDVESIKELLEVQDRTKAGKTAPASGLYLVKVFYPSVASG